MCVCIKRLINSTFLGRVSLDALLVCSTWARVSPPSWMLHGFNLSVVMATHSGSFSLGWRVQRVILKGSMVLGDISWNTAEGEVQRESYFIRRDRSLCYCASCMRIFLFQELKEENKWYSHSDGRSPYVTIFLVSMRPFLLAEHPWRLVWLWCWDEWISFSHEQMSLQGQIHTPPYTYVCICDALITNQILYFNTRLCWGTDFFSFGP